MNSKTTVAKPSRKARVKELFSEQGPEEAFVLGKRLKLKASTLHSWLGSWRREAAKAKATKARARTEKKRVTKVNRQQEGKAELAAQAAPKPESAPTPVEVQS